MTNYDNSRVPDEKGRPAAKSSLRALWPTSRERRLPVALTALIALAIVAYAVGGFEWLQLVAIAGTALGTLSLAFYTYELASATGRAERQSRRLIEISQQQLATARDDVAASHEQLATARDELTASRRQAEAAQRSSVETARARIDATAPIVDLAVAQGEVLVLEGGEPVLIEGEPVTLADQEWYEPQLDSLRFETPLRLTFMNYGESPAHVFFPSLDPDPIGLARATRGSRYLTLAPGERYEDSMVIRLSGREALRGRHCHVVVTYNSPVQGAMFDTLRWRGTLQLLRNDGGTIQANDQIPLNAGPSQVVREYPALERPDEMAAAIERFAQGPGANR